MVNTNGIEEIELYIEVVRVKQQMSQSVGAYIDLLVRGNDNVAELDYGCGPSSASTPDTDRCEVYMEMMKTVKIKKLMMNLMKMVMMNLMEI